LTNALTRDLVFLSHRRRETSDKPDERMSGIWDNSLGRF
jgi:hypothetical protein